MCIYVISETNPARACNIDSYFKHAPKVTQPGWEVLTFPELPVDNEGRCIFHSQDIDWKLKNKFHKWMKHLVTYIEWYDRTPFMTSPTGSPKTIDLTGVFLIGKEVKLKSGVKETVLRFCDLVLKDSIEIKLDYAYIADKFVFEQCKIHKVELVFNHTTIDGEFFMSNCTMAQMSFNNTKLSGGFIMSNCEFSHFAEFGGMIVKNAFQISNSHFENHAFFSSSNFRCESVLIENVQFQGKADFNLCTFHGDVEIQECHFDQLVNFTDARFNSTVGFTGNYYEDNVQFISSGKENRVFYDNVRFTFTDPENEVQGRLIFDNVNFYLIAGKDREELMSLARVNKVTIGSGCIKYRVQTPPVAIATDDINKNIALELAQSFTNYFISSTGKSLGVEFTDNTINKITLFYYTDEDITLGELTSRLKMAEAAYWASGAPGPSDESTEETKRKIDNYIGKVAILMKMSMLQQYQLMSEGTVEEIVKAIGFDSQEDRASQIQLTINQYNHMKIGKIIAQPNSQVNIADNIRKIEFNPKAAQLSREGIQQIKDVLLKLDQEEMRELQEALAVVAAENDQLTIAELVRLKLNEFAVKHGVPIIDGIAASALFEFLKLVISGS